MGLSHVYLNISLFLDFHVDLPQFSNKFINFKDSVSCQLLFKNFVTEAKMGENRKLKCLLKGDGTNS